MPGHNALDRQLAGQPRDYVSNPPGFGTPAAGRAVPAPAGAGVPGRVAIVQHRLVMAWLARNRRGDSARICRTWGFSPSTWSRIVHGQRWAGSIGMAALLAEIESREHARDRHQRG